MLQLRPYQEPHFRALLATLQQRRAALDASDTGTGKTVVALFLCRALDIVPLVIGPKTARAGWERLANQVHMGIEYVNYEKLRGRRAVPPEKQAAYERALVAYKTKIAPWIAAEETNEYEALAQLGSPPPPPDVPRPVTTTDWIVEQPWGKGSFLKWKNSYECIIFDEVHRCGGSTSLNSKLLIAAKRQAKYVLGLSATAADDPRQMKALGYALGLHGLSKKLSRGQPDFMTWLLQHGCSPGVWGGFDFTQDAGRQKVAFTKLHREIFPEHGARMRKIEIPGFPKTQIDVKLLTDETGRAAALAEELHEASVDGVPLRDTMTLRLKLENLMVPHLVELVQDYGAIYNKLVVFCSFTQPLQRLVDELRTLLGHDQVGYISGAQAGKQGETERNRFLDLFQANRIAILICNIQAGGESCNLHDPTGQVERTTLITPCESGRQFKQVTGRVNRDGGAFSLQLLTYFANTYQEVVAARLARKSFNIDLLNDADFGY